MHLFFLEHDTRQLRMRGITDKVPCYDMRWRYQRRRWCDRVSLADNFDPHLSNCTYTNMNLLIEMPTMVGRKNARARDAAIALHAPNSSPPLPTPFVINAV